MPKEDAVGLSGCSIALLDGIDVMKMAVKRAYQERKVMSYDET